MDISRIRGQPPRIPHDPSNTANYPMKMNVRSFPNPTSSTFASKRNAQEPYVQDVPKRTNPKTSMGKYFLKPSTLKGVVHTIDNKNILGPVPSSSQVKNLNQIAGKGLEKLKRWLREQRKIL